jgi:hypothetical protein
MVDGRGIAPACLLPPSAPPYTSPGHEIHSPALLERGRLRTGDPLGARECCVRERERERGERDKDDLYGEEDKNLRVFLHMCMTTEGVWTQVAQHNKLGVLDFDFASSWT